LKRGAAADLLAVPCFDFGDATQEGESKWETEEIQEAQQDHDHDPEDADAPKDLEAEF
jgi:hypothetical protein